MVDQSNDGETAETVARFVQLGARTIPCDGRGIALAMNVGLEQAAHPVVLVTHDDCRVDSSWVGVAHGLMAAGPGRDRDRAGPAAR